MTPEREKFYDAALGYFQSKVGDDDGLILFEKGMAIGVEEHRFDWFKTRLEAFRSGDFSALKTTEKLKYPPIDLLTFLHHPYYLGLETINSEGKRVSQIFPKVMDELQELNSGKYVEAVLTGAIGTGKTAIAVWTNAYQLYLLSCLKDPQQTYNLDRASEIVFIFQSITRELAKTLDYARFKALVEVSPYFRDKFPFNKDIESKLLFPNRIEVKPVAGTDTGAIGQNVMGGIIDELNFMAVTEKSKNSIDGGEYDQALALYNSISRRRKSRFMTQGKLPGILCLVSSKRYPGQFTDRKQEEQQRDIMNTGASTIYVYDKRTWEIMPEDRFTGQFFKLFIGNSLQKPRILKDGEKMPEGLQPLVMDVPIEYLSEFQNDIMNALRDIAGVSTIARHPFMMDVDKVAACFKKEHSSILSAEFTDFQDFKIAIHPRRFYKPDIPRWVHIDLAVTGDSAGVACGTVIGFERIKRGLDDSENMPKLWYDFLLEVKPPAGGEILFYKIRDLIYKLSELGLNIKWISLDSYQSVDSIQIFRKKMYTAGIQSIDRTTLPYDMLKSAFYDNRVDAPEHEKARDENIALERDLQKGKIDHPPNGSKDISDAMAGVAYGASLRTELWILHDADLLDIPESMQAIMQQAHNMKTQQQMYR